MCVCILLRHSGLGTERGSPARHLVKRTDGVVDIGAVDRTLALRGCGKLASVERVDVLSPVAHVAAAKRLADDAVDRLCRERSMPALHTVAVHCCSVPLSAHVALTLRSTRHVPGGKGGGLGGAGGSGGGGGDEGGTGGDDGGAGSAGGGGGVGGAAVAHLVQQTSEMSFSEDVARSAAGTVIPYLLSASWNCWSVIEHMVPCE